MTTQTWTTRRLLRWTSEYFESKGIDSPRLAAEMLLAHILGCKRLELYMHADRPASELERAAFRELVERAAEHEPVDYLVGHTSFFSLMFEVSPAVLIPRPSTETLVEHIIRHARSTPGFHAPAVADIGTGSSAIAVAVAKNLPQSRVTATDISREALTLAERNAKRHDVADRIDFVAGDLFEPLAGRRFHYIASNPPYISDVEWQDVPANVKDYEPHRALRAGPDGLDFIHPLIAHARDYLESPGQLVLEIAASQKDAVLELANEHGYANAHVLADHEALPRVLVADVE